MTRDARRFDDLMNRAFTPFRDVPDEQVKMACGQVLTELRDDMSPPTSALRRKPQALDDAVASAVLGRRSSQSEGVRRKAMTFAAAAVVVIAAVGTAILWRPADQVLFSLVEGSVHRDGTIRTNGGAGAVLALPDGSRIEMRSQSELSLERADDGLRIRLMKGGIIVNAATQRAGHLYVLTKDVTVSVIGTVFLVNAEERGSRVAVIEGEVRVQQGTVEKKLLPGEQVATSPVMAPSAITEEIAWSRNAEQHRALLQQVAILPAPQLRSPGSKEERVAFEEYSIRPSGSSDANGGRGGAGRNPLGDGCSGGPVQIDGRRLLAPNKTLYHLSAVAYGTPGRGCGYFASTGLLSGGPPWMKFDQFDVEALLPGGSPIYTRQQLENAEAPVLQAMLRTLLAESFHLVIRREMRETAVYVLTVTDGGHRLAPSTVEGRGNTGLGPRIQNGQVSLALRANKTTMGGLADLLRLVTRLPVLDRTNVAGEFAINISFVPPDVSHPLIPSGGGLTLNGPTLFAALEELGLRLERRRDTVEVLVVDSAEKPPGN